MQVARILACLLVIGCVAPPRAEGSRFELVVLGIAQDGGVPHVGCRRECCERARAAHAELFPACLAIRDLTSGATLLIEATPAIEKQLALLPPPRGQNPVDALLLTHAHIGHYLGLAHFGREVAATRELPVFVTPRFASFLREHGPWRQLVALEQITIHELAEGARCEPLPGLAVEAIRVPHRDEFSDTVAFRIRGARRTVLFVPDVDAWDKAPGLLERLLDGVDLAFVDGTFYDGSELPGRNRAEIPHPPITDTMRRLAARARAAPGSIRFLHLNHTNPALGASRARAEIEARGFAVAAQGERHAL